MLLTAGSLDHHPYTVYAERANTVNLTETRLDSLQISMRLFLIVTAPTGRGEFTPRHLRVYANHPQIIDFSDADTTKPHLNISLLEGETGVVEYPLRVAAFANVTSLSLFFVSHDVPGYILPGRH